MRDELTFGIGDTGTCSGVSRRSLLKAAGVTGLVAGAAMKGMAQQQPQESNSACAPAPLETRTIAQLYAAALQEGGELVVVEGGDAINQDESLVSAFQAQFPKMKLNLSVDLSKYNAARIDLAFAKNTTPPDVVHLQTIENFPRWKKEDRLLNYKPIGWEHVYPHFKDPEGAWTGLGCIVFSNVVNTSIPAASVPRNFLDYLDPKYKGKLIFTYPNDDDAALFLFYTAIKEHGWSYMESLMANHPTFVRGTYPAGDVVASGSKLATFTASGPAQTISGSPIQLYLPTTDKFLAWGQRAAIFKDAAHPNAAKLWTSWNLQPSTQALTGTWPVRDDVTPPAGFLPIINYENASLPEFPAFMENRAEAERFRAIIQLYVGDPLGPDPGTTYTSPS